MSDSAPQPPEERLADQSGAAREAESDQALIARYRAGDVSAFNQLQQRHTSLVYRCSYRQLAHRTDAEDAVGEVMLRLFRYLSRAETPVPDNLGAWLAATATNVCRDMLRKRPRLPTLLPGREETEGEPGLGQLSRSREPDPAAACDQDTRLARCIEELPANFRAVIMMKYEEELMQVEMAAVLGVTEPAVSQRLANARELLRQCLEAHGITAPWQV